MKRESNRTVYFAIGGNIVIAIAKFAAAFFTGSSAMISEGIHSLVDTADGLLLLLGKSRSQKPATDEHPFGHGLELYFWTLIVAIMIFALGGGMSIYEGISHWRHPAPLVNAKISYIVLVIAILAEGSSFLVALKDFKKQKKYPSIWRSIRMGKDPTIFTVLFEDSAALMGLGIALVATFLEQTLEDPRIGAVASILIGLVLATVALILTRESKELLLGESVRPPVKAEILRILQSHSAIEKIEDLKTMHFGPQSVLVVIKALVNSQKLKGSFAEEAETIRKEITRKYPGNHFIYLEPST